MDQATETREVRLFLCYRRADGAWHAESIHRQLNGAAFADAEGAPCRLSVYYDKTAPGVADWKTLHFPSLQASHALILICTPGIATDLSERARPDWVYRELHWWERNRKAAPIVVDATGEGHRWLPELIRRKWPDINRIDFVRSDTWSAQEPSEISERIRDRVIGAIRESERATVFDDLERFKRLTHRLFLALVCSVLLLGAVVTATVVAIRARGVARRQALANASYIFSDRDPTIALRFAQKTGRPLDPTAAVAMLRAFNSGSWLYSQRFDGAWDADLSKDGKRLAWIESGKTLHLVDLSTGKATQASVSSSNIRFVPSGNLVLWSGWNGRGTLGHVEILTPAGDLVARHEFEFLLPVFSPDGTVFIPSFSGDEMVVQVVDSKSGTVKPLSLGRSVESLGDEAVALPDGTGLVVATKIPGHLVVARTGGNRDVLQIPTMYVTSDVAVDAAGQRAVVYLSGAIRDVTDALGWVDLTTPGLGGLKIVPLPMSPGFDSGGLVRFLPDGKVIAASADGWTRIVDLDTRASTDLSTRSRAADTIEISPKGNLIVIARRSGVVTIYNSDGVAVGRLLGEASSDGLNPVFERMAIDDAGTMILTVARTGTRLWQRPPYQLTVPHNAGFRPFDDVPDGILAPLREVKFPAAGDDANACEGTGRIPVRDNGEIGLCIQINSRKDEILTGLTKEEVEVMGSEKLGKFGQRLIGERVDRIFVLSPELVSVLVERESSNGRLWQIDEATENMWTTRGASPEISVIREDSSFRNGKTP